MVRIPEHQATQLVNRTSKIPNDDHYIVSIDVFHQLHCLDNMRKYLWPQHYNLSSLDAEPNRGKSQHIRT